MVAYYQFVPDDLKDEILELTIQHVKEHLSAVASKDDDPSLYAANVIVFTEPATRESDGTRGILIRGILDADPVAPYLYSNFDPKDDIKTNPLSVPSILEDK